MSEGAVKRERAEQMLGELAELSLMLARDLAVQARQAEDVEEKVALTQAFQKMSRTVRLTLALDRKLDRDAARDARDAAKDAREAARDAEALAAATERESLIRKATEAANRGPDRITREENQKRRVRGVLNRLLWNEAEGDEEEYEVLLEDLDARLYEAEDAPGFADLPIEVLAGKLAADMRLAGELVVTTAATIIPAPPLRSGGGGPPAEERVVEAANATPQPPLADTG